VPVPSDDGFQFGTLMLQVPFGVVPAPAVLPFRSQNGSPPEPGGGFSVAALVVGAVAGVVAVVLVVAVVAAVAVLGWVSV